MRVYASSYLRVSCSVSLCPLRSTGILDFSGRCLNDWRHHFSLRLGTPFEKDGRSGNLRDAARRRPRSGHRDPSSCCDGRRLSLTVHLRLRTSVVHFAFINLRNLDKSNFEDVPFSMPGRACQDVNVDNILRYTNRFVTHDAVPAQYMPLLFHGGVPISISAPTKSIRFLGLRDSNLSHSKRRYQDQEQSAAWHAACGTAFSNKPSHQTLGSAVRISSLIPCGTLDVSVVICD